MLKLAVIGKDGRTSAIINSLKKSPRVGRVISLSDWKSESTEKARARVLERAMAERPDFVVVGPEEPLAEGIVDDLEAIGIPCIGPTKSLARLESSKAFTRGLVSEYQIPGNPEYRVFSSLDGIEDYLRTLAKGYVVKPDGLTGGKGVKISDAHLFSISDAVDYCREILSANHEFVIIEEKLDGEEFSLMSFCDGDNVADMVVVQDHKRVGEGDTGPNTGGMGSYSCEDHSLPFLDKEHLREASYINAQIAKALFKKTGQKYRGILYGGFMLTSDGIKLLEYNARFGDPETLNALSILKTDFASVCEAMIAGTLDKLAIEFEPLATVCKYVVPMGYPDNPVKNEQIDLSQVDSESDVLKIYFAALDEKGDEKYLSGSRAVAFVGIGKNLAEAESIAEKAAAAVKGPVYHRKDIGKHSLIQARIDHVKSLSNRALC